jgi:hypothetical protein
MLRSTLRRAAAGIRLWGQTSHLLELDLPVALYVYPHTPACSQLRMHCPDIPLIWCRANIQRTLKGKAVDWEPLTSIWLINSNRGDPSRHAAETPAWAGRQIADVKQLSAIDQLPK